ncbi:MAG: M23 family metallopeptidase [Myxococcaceae bacterium]
MTTISLLSLALLAGTPAGNAPEFSVPFGCGLNFPVSQAHDTGSHKNTDVWAWDFKMPEGIPITAAADGVVRLARGDTTQGGCGEEYAAYANYVILAHAGGYETQYLHFQKVVVKEGDKVKAGDVIGYSGKTGWACGSHLHFKVTKNTGTGWNNDSVPARIVGYGDPEVQTVIYAPACGDTSKQVNVMAQAQKNDESAAKTALNAQLPDGQKNADQIQTGTGASVVTNTAP